MLKRYRVSLDVHYFQRGGVIHQIRSHAVMAGSEFEAETKAEREYAASHPAAADVVAIFAELDIEACDGK